MTDHDMLYERVTLLWHVVWRRSFVLACCGKIVIVWRCVCNGMLNEGATVWLYAVCRRDSVMAYFMHAWLCDGMLCEDVAAEWHVVLRRDSVMICWMKPWQCESVLYEGVKVWLHGVYRHDCVIACCMKVGHRNDMLYEEVTAMAYCVWWLVLNCHFLLNMKEISK